MPDQSSCEQAGGTYSLIHPGIFWLIPPGVDPATVLSQQEIDCYFLMAEQTNAAFEANEIAAGRYVAWRSSPYWHDFAGALNSEWKNATHITEPNINCDHAAYAAAFQTYWIFKSAYAKGLATDYCISATPPPPPIDPPPPDGGVGIDCGAWDVEMLRPITIQKDVPYWIDYRIIGSFPSGAQGEPTIRIQFDGFETLVQPNTVSGVLEIDLEGRQFKVVLKDTNTHTITITAINTACTFTSNYDSEVLQVLEFVPPVCAPVYTKTSAAICKAGVYKAVLTICDLDHESNVFTLDTDGSQLPPPPVITKHPQSKTVNQFDLAVLDVIATHATNFRWQVNNGAAWVDILPPELGPNLVFESVEPLDAGTYRVIALNAAGSATSNAAILTVVIDASCIPYITLQCVDDAPATCHDVRLHKFGSGNSAGDYILGWTSSIGPCDVPVVIRASDGTFWELYMQKVGAGTASKDYLIRWKTAVAPYGEPTMLASVDASQCFEVTLVKVGAGTTEEDYVLDWKNI